jgi:hypothetical protein
MKLTNTTRETLGAIPIKGEAKDGNAPTDSLAPGETKEIAVDPENITVKGLLLMGVLVAEHPSRKTKE